MINKTFKETVELMTHAITALAFLFGIYQFCSYRNNKKIEYSLSKNSSYLTSDIKTARGKLIFPSDLLERCKTINTNIGKGSGVNLAKWIMTSKARANEEDFFYVFKFYGSVYSCIKHNLCNLKHVDKFLLSDAKSFFRNFHSFLKEYKTNKKNNESIVNWTNEVEEFYLTLEL